MQCLISPKTTDICICVTHNNKWPIHYPWHKHYYTLQLNATWKKMSTNFSMQYISVLYIHNDKYSHKNYSRSLSHAVFEFTYFILTFKTLISRRFVSFFLLVYLQNFGRGPIKFTKIYSLNYFTFWSINTTAAVVYGTFSLVWRPSAEWCDEYYVRKLFRLNFPCSHQFFVRAFFLSLFLKSSLGSLCICMCVLNSSQFR